MQVDSLPAEPQGKPIYIKSSQQNSRGQKPGDDRVLMKKNVSNNVTYQTDHVFMGADNEEVINILTSSVLFWQGGGRVLVEKNQDSE